MARRALRSTAACVALAGMAAVLLAGFLALGIWQVERRAWKLALIERVEQRVHAAPAPLALPSPPDAWPPVSAASDEYRHLQVSGRFLHEHETLVQAVTRLGSGFWVMTPLQLPDGRTLLVNRGFVPPEARDRSTRSATENAAAVTLTGLLRLSEPEGGFLRKNDPAASRWYSRDVQAIARARALERVAPFFLDVDAPAQGRGDAATAWPVGGLTVTSFSNSHLVYALTWFGLALMVLGASVLVLREERRHRAGFLEENAEHADLTSEAPCPD
ncbi:MAG: SURF1 family protein [Polaromonas sp.]